MNREITEIIKQHALEIAEQAYPIIPMGNTELEFTVGSEDGEYQVEMDAMHLSFARVHFTAAIANNIPVAMAQAAFTLATSECLRKTICDRDADFYYDSDGHYETGNTLSKNRDNFWGAFPSRKNFRDYAMAINPEVK